MDNPRINIDQCPAIIYVYDGLNNVINARNISRLMWWNERKVIEYPGEHKAKFQIPNTKSSWYFDWYQQHRNRVFSKCNLYSFLFSLETSEWKSYGIYYWINIWKLFLWNKIPNFQMIFTSGRNPLLVNESYQGHYIETFPYLLHFELKQLNK